MGGTEQPETRECTEKGMQGGEQGGHGGCNEGLLQFPRDNEVLFLGNATHLNAANYCSCKSRVVLSAKNCGIHQNKPVEKRQHQGHALGITSSHHPGHGKCPCPPGNEVSLRSLPSQSTPAFQDPFPAFLQQYLSHHFFS